MELPLPWTPPYALKTREQALRIAGMLRQRNDLSAETTEFLERFEYFAQTKEVQGSPLAARLPKRVECELVSLAPGVQPAARSLPPAIDRDDPLRPFRRLQENYRRHAAVDGGLSYHEAIERLLKRDSPDADETEAPARSLSDALHNRKRFFAGLTEAFNRYIETKSDAEKRRLLQACYTVLVYDSSGRIDERLLAALQKDPEHYERRDLRTIHERHCRRLDGLRRSLIVPLVVQQLEKAKRATARTRLPAQVRSNLIRHLNDAVSTAEVSRIEALVRRAIELYRPHASSDDVVRVQGIMTNALRKHRRIHAFFEREFLKPEIEALHTLWGPSQRESASPDQPLVQRVKLSFYPTKDYFDFLKAIPSADCTWWPSLAGNHVLSPRFLNLRIFRDRYWMGNVYLLDYRREHGAIVIDRIQLQDAEGFFPVGFFANVVKRLVDELVDCVPEARVMAAESISNASFVQQSFLAETRGLRRVELAFDDGDRGFECAQGRPLVVLHD